MIIITERLRGPGILILQRVLVLCCVYVSHASGIRHARNSGRGCGGVGARARSLMRHVDAATGSWRGHEREKE